MLKAKILREQGQPTAAPQQAAPAAPAANAAPVAPAADPKAIEKQKQEFVKILNGTIQALQAISQGLSQQAAAPAAPAAKPAATAPAAPAAPAKGTAPK